ncbi:hypothetical protein JAB9_46270 [Janthinobacterium sp. HH107]|nr:hypothetical protein JAB9_46270 [Janthinobacterium sp. HH107]
MVDAPAHARDDLVDDLHQVGVVGEADVAQLQAAMALDIHLPIGVDEDVGHAGIGQQRFERAEAEHLVLDVADQRAPFQLVDHHIVFREHVADEDFQLFADLLARQALHALQVDAVEQRLVGAVLELLVAVARCALVRGIVIQAGVILGIAQAVPQGEFFGSHGRSPVSGAVSGSRIRLEPQARASSRETQLCAAGGVSPARLAASSCRARETALCGVSFRMGTPWLTEAATAS